MKRKKLILCFIGAVLLMTGCGGEASLPVYSNLSEEQGSVKRISDEVL